MTDAEAIQAVKSGQKQRYAELVERHQSMVYGIAWSRLGNRDLCDEAAQETFIKAYRYLEALRDPAHFPGWLARIARNVSTSLLRRRKAELDKHRRWELTQPEAETPVHEDEKPLGETLRQVLTDMPLQHRECLVLFYLDGKSVQETAQLLGISETAARTRLHRARHALRGRLEEAVETSLSNLAPRQDFTAGVMPLLPALPLAATLAESSLATKIFGVGAKSAVGLSILLWMTAANAVLVSAVFAGLGRLEAANLAPGSGTRFRTQVIRREALMTTLALFSMVPIMWAVLTLGGGPLAAYRLLVPLLLWQTYRRARSLRVNRTPFAISVFLTSLTLLVVITLIGFFNAPFDIFFLAVMPLGLVTFYTDKTRPLRHDYNLFLRQTQGLLGEPNEASDGEVRFTRPGLQAFARFLGERFLIADYRFDAEGIVLALPPVKKRLGQFYGFTGSDSKVRIDTNGRCHASLGKKDLRDIHALAEGTSVDKDSLELRVAEVMRSAYELFAAGQAGQAETILQKTRNDEVFLKPVAKSMEHWVRTAVAIGCALVMLIFILIKLSLEGWGNG